MKNSFTFIAISCLIIIGSSFVFTMMNEDISSRHSIADQIDRKYNDREYEDLFSGNVIYSSNLGFDIEDHESAMAAYEKYREEIANIMFRNGQIEREYIDRERDYSATRDDIFFENSDFAIYESEITKIDEGSKVMGREDGREHAIMIILRREILYSEALKHGYSASHEEIKDAINSFMESLRSADNFESDFLPFLDGLGMTYEEYWETQYDLYKKNITTQKFMSGEREAMNYRYMIGDQVIIEYMPQRYIDELIDSYIEAHDLKRILKEN